MAFLKFDDAVIYPHCVISSVGRIGHISPRSLLHSVEMTQLLTHSFDLCNPLESKITHWFQLVANKRPAKVNSQINPSQHQWR